MTDMSRESGDGGFDRQVSRRRFLKSTAAAGLIAAGVGGSRVPNAFAAMGASPYDPRLKGMGHDILGVTSLVAVSLGAKHAWTQLGQSFTEQSYDGDPNKELNQAELFGGINVKMVTSYLVSDALYTPYGRALAKQKIAYHNISNAVPWRFPLEPIFRGYFIGHIQGSFADESYSTAIALFKAAGGEGELIHLRGVKGGASDNERTTGFMAALKKFPKVKIVATQFVNWDTVQAQTATEQLVPAHPKVRMIFGQNDSIGTGAVKALRSLRKSGVKVSGVDGDPEFLQMIADGDHAVTTVAVRYDLVGVMAAVRLFDFTHGVKYGDGRSGTFDPLESMLWQDGVFIDSPAAAKAMLALTPKGKDVPPYDARKASRHLHPKDWTVQTRIQMVDPYLEWGPHGANPTRQPAGFKWPKTYKDALTPSHAAKLNAEWIKRERDIFASVRAKSSYGGPVLGTLVRKGLVPNYRPYTPPAGYR